MMEANQVKILLVDFDGVLHSYTSGWQGANKVNDPPVPGAMAWLIDCTKYFEVCVYSSRSKDPDGVAAMKGAIMQWLQEGLGWHEGDADHAVNTVLRFPTEKPAAFLTIDDRCIQFDGTFIEPKKLTEFKTWMQK